MQIVSINILKKVKTSIKKLGNTEINAACANLFIVCIEYGS